MDKSKTELEKLLFGSYQFVNLQRYELYAQNIQHVSINVNNILTRVSYLLPNHYKEQDNVILFIPGNPGVIEFYDSFLEQLHSYSGLPIYGVSYAGHNLAEYKSRLVERLACELHPNIKTSSRYIYTLEEQISHKISFILQYIKPNKKIIIIAHSLGSYITLEILKRLPSLYDVVKIILLFPVFERTMQTVRGKALLPKITSMAKPMVTTGAILEKLPSSMKKTLISLVAGHKRYRPDSVESMISAITSFITTGALRNMVQTAHDLSKIGDSDHFQEVIKKYEKKLTFYYGATDEWTPVSFQSELRQKFPDMDIRVDEFNTDHCFVMESCRNLTTVVGDIIIRNKQDRQRTNGILPEENNDNNNGSCITKKDNFATKYIASSMQDTENYFDRHKKIVTPHITDLLPSISI